MVWIVKVFDLLIVLLFLGYSRYFWWDWDKGRYSEFIFEVFWINIVKMCIKEILCVFFDFLVEYISKYK